MVRSMLFKVSVLAALLVAVAFAGGRGAIADDAGTPEASPMASPAMGMGGNGAAYMTIANAGSESDRLVAGKTDAAEIVEIHEIAKDESGVMQMRPLADGLEIPAGGEAVLEPGGYHVMLIGLTEDLVAGKTFELTLTFANAGEVVVQVPVQRMAPEGDAVISLTSGDLTISGVWSRPAPALKGEMMASPVASPTM